SRAARASTGRRKIESKLKLGILGGGVMATAILRSLVQGGLLPASQVAASDPLEACRQAVSRLGARAVAVNAEAVHDADVVLLAVKPGVVPAVLREVRGAL